MDDKEEMNKKVSFWIKPSQYKTMERIAHDRGDDAVAGVMREAVSEYIERKENPGLIKDQIRRALREEPSLVAEAVQIYAARKLQKK